MTHFPSGVHSDLSGFKLACSACILEGCEKLRIKPMGKNTLFTMAQVGECQPRAYPGRRSCLLKDKNGLVVRYCPSVLCFALLLYINRLWNKLAAVQSKLAIPLIDLVFSDSISFNLPLIPSSHPFPGTLAHLLEQTPTRTPVLSTGPTQNCLSDYPQCIHKWDKTFREKSPTCAMQSTKAIWKL